MKIFRKIRVGSKSAASAKINALGIDEEGNPTHNNAIVRLGHIVVTPAEIDEEGNIITEAVLSDITQSMFYGMVSQIQIGMLKWCGVRQ
jgi:hypothetical protein